MLNAAKSVESKRRYDGDDALLVGIVLMIPIRWDDDVVFRNQARGTENKGRKEFVNVTCHCVFTVLLALMDLFQDLLRSDFHKRFMVRTNSPARASIGLADRPTYRANMFADPGLATNWDHLDT